MVKKWVTWDEWYPVNMLDEDTDGSYCHAWQSIEFTDAEVAEITNLFNRFKDWQSELENRLEASRIAWELANPEERARQEKAHQEYLRSERALGHIK